eukprot:4948832-Amphidinium_carterae.1
MHDQAHQLLQDSDSTPLDVRKGGWAEFMLTEILVNEKRLKLQLCVNIGGQSLNALRRRSGIDSGLNDCCPYYKARPTAPGPDGCGYAHLQVLADDVIKAVVLFLEEMRGGHLHAMRFYDPCWPLCQRWSDLLAARISFDHCRSRTASQNWFPLRWHI